MNPIPSLRVYVLSWNGGDATAECVTAVLRSEGVRPDVIVVDNDSGDGSAARLAERLGPERVLALGENRGYAGGMNAAVEHLGHSGEACALLLTQDVVVAPAAIARMLDAMRADERAGIVGPVVVYRERPRRVIGAGGRIEPRRVRAPVLREVRQAEPYPVDWLDGCCLLVRHAALHAVGGFDERYFMYYEETDLCQRVRGGGWSVALAPAAEVRHDKTGAPAAWYYYYMTRNRYRFWRENFGVGTARVAVSVALDTAVSLGTWGKSLLLPSRRPERRERRQRFFAQLRGAIAGTAAHLRGRSGRMPGPDRSSATAADG